MFNKYSIELVTLCTNLLPIDCVGKGKIKKINLSLQVSRLLHLFVIVNYFWKLKMVKCLAWSGRRRCWDGAANEHFQVLFKKIQQLLIVKWVIFWHVLGGVRERERERERERKIKFWQLRSVNFLSRKIFKNSSKDKGSLKYAAVVGSCK